MAFVKERFGLGFVYPAPVSYTHLDVYKRQTVLPLARLISNMADGVLVPIALCAALLGNLAGTALRRYRRG